MRIGSKAEFYRLWRAGVLGNTPRTWATIEEAMAADPVPEVIAFREAGRPGGRHEFVALVDAFMTAFEWELEGRPYSLDETAPDEHVTLQGEICRAVGGLRGYLALNSGLRMREAMAKGLMRNVTGATVLALLGCYADASSRDDLEALLDLYPDAVIEFACYPFEVGVLPNRNTIIWEVRDY